MKSAVDDRVNWGLVDEPFACWAITSPAEQSNPAIHRTAKPRLVLSLITCHSPCKLRFMLIPNTAHTYESIRRLVSKKLRDELSQPRVALELPLPLIQEDQFGCLPQPDGLPTRRIRMESERVRQARQFSTDLTFLTTPSCQQHAILPTIQGYLSQRNISPQRDWAFSSQRQWAAIFLFQSKFCLNHYSPPSTAAAHIRLHGECHRQS